MTKARPGAVSGPLSGTSHIGTGTPTAATYHLLAQRFQVQKGTDVVDITADGDSAHNFGDNGLVSGRCVIAGIATNANSIGFGNLGNNTQVTFDLDFGGTSGGDIEVRGLMESITLAYSRTEAVAAVQYDVRAEYIKDVTLSGTPATSVAHARPGSVADIATISTTQAATTIDFNIVSMTCSAQTTIADSTADGDSYRTWQDNSLVTGVLDIQGLAAGDAVLEFDTITGLDTDATPTVLVDETQKIHTVVMSFNGQDVTVTGYPEILTANWSRVDPVVPVRLRLRIETISD